MYPLFRPQGLKIDLPADKCQLVFINWVKAKPYPDALGLEQFFNSPLYTDVSMTIYVMKSLLNCMSPPKATCQFVSLILNDMDFTIQ